MVKDPGSDVPARLFVDSGAWLAFFSARDNHHADADVLFREALARNISLLTSNLVLAEVQRLLLFRAGIAPARTALEKIDQSGKVKILFLDQATHRDAQAWLAKLKDQVISYADAASFALMKAHKCQHAISFDHDFVLAGYSLWRP